MRMPRKIDRALSLYRSGVTSPKEIANSVGCSRATVYAAIRMHYGLHHVKKPDPPCLQQVRRMRLALRRRKAQYELVSR